MNAASSSDHDSLDLRIGRILNDHFDRRALGVAETEEELLARHPDCAEELAAHLALLRDLQRGPGTIPQLVEQGVLERSPDPAWAARLDAYGVTDFLGQGGMGVVLKGFDAQLRRPVALKVLRPELACDAAALARLKREAQAAAALRHPNIVTIYSVGQARHIHYLAMEYVNGPTLSTVIRERGPLPGDVVRSVFSQLLQGLAAAHAAGVIHRDIKSSNILLDAVGVSVDAVGASVDAVDEVGASAGAVGASAGAGGSGRQPSSRSPGASDGTPLPLGGEGRVRGAAAAVRPSPDPSVQVRGVMPATPLRTSTVREGPETCPDRSEAIASGGPCTVKIADFGLARMLTAQTRLTLEGSTPGTPEYMSPEQARGDEAVDQRSDLYSAGVVLYEMLTGRTPFRADTPSAVIHRILHEEPRHPCKLYGGADPYLADFALRLLAKRPEDRFASADEAMAHLEESVRIGRPEVRRRRLAQAAFLVSAATLVWAVVALLGRSGERAITDLRIEKIDDAATCTLLVRYDNSPNWIVLRVLPREAHYINSAVRVDAYGTGRPLAVAGTFEPVNGDCVFAFDAGGNDVWSANLSSELEWPDCKRGPGEFRCLWLDTVPAEDHPGEDLVVAACDVRDYPTRISILDARTGRARSTFLHFGQLPDGRTVPGYFDGQRPAILAWGENNKLDGFDDAPVPDQEPPAHWETVKVVVILDPRNMNGLGPPHMMDGLEPPNDPQYGALLSLPPAPIQAYAFFDTPSTTSACAVSYVMIDGGLERWVDTRPRPHEETAVLSDVMPSTRLAKPSTGPWFSLQIASERPDSTPQDLAHLIVDRDLTLVDAQSADPVRRPEAGNFDLWRQRWRVLIRNGAYVGD